MTAPLILALDFGGTKHAAATWFAGDTRWRRYAQNPAPPQADSSSDLDMMEHLAASVLGSEAPAAVGVSFGGPIDFTSGTVRLSHHVPGWEELPLKSMLAQKFNAPVVVDNDANIAAYGEYKRGAGRKAESVLYLTISTGVGGGWILDGRIWRGSRSMAGEIGHLSLDPNGPVCLCGKNGCLERFASGPYMVEDILAALEKNPGQGDIILNLAGGAPGNVTARHLAQAARRGDPLASGRLEQAGWAVGTAIGNAANLMDPERIVIGGGIAGAGELFWNNIRAQARRVALPEIELDIRPAALGGDAPLWGAAILASELL